MFDVLFPLQDKLDCGDKSQTESKGAQKLKQLFSEDDEKPKIFIFRQDKRRSWN